MTYGSRGRAGPAAAITLVALLAAGAPARAEPDAAAPPWVEVHDGLLTVSARAAPLGALLRTVGEAAGFEVPVIDPGETFTGAFSALPLADGLERLLPAWSFALHYDEAGNPQRLVLLIAGQTAAHPPEPSAPAPAPPVSGHALAADENWIADRLTSPDRGTRIVAVRRLDRLPADRAAALGLGMLNAEPDPVVRAQLAAALGRVGGDRVVDVLTPLLDDRDPTVRVAAARALARPAGDAAVHALGRTVLQVGDPALRQAALESLAAHPGETARDYLGRAASLPGDPIADTARRLLAGETASGTAEDATGASPCLHAAGRLQGTCRER